MFERMDVAFEAQQAVLQQAASSAEARQQPEAQPAAAQVAQQGGGGAAPQPADVAAALGTFFRVLGDTLSLLLKLLLVEPMSFVLNKLGLQVSRGREGRPGGPPGAAAAPRDGWGVPLPHKFTHSACAGMA